MKISGKFILKVAGTLTVISLVVALLLGLVNGVTKDKIAAIEADRVAAQLLHAQAIEGGLEEASTEPAQQIESRIAADR